MRTLEHRRHSRRDPSGVQLNAAGRALARSVGAILPRFDRVVTSPKPRAIETAERMGRRVDATVPELGTMPDDLGVLPGAEAPHSFADYARWVRESPIAARYARTQSARWRAELERVPDGGSLLMISHGGVIELGAVAALPRRAATWGGPLGYLEGVRLTWDGRWVSGEVLRVSERAPRPD